MAKKIFSIHNGGQGSGWFSSNKPNPTVLQDISTADNNGKLATSIPSPFARIDLVKNAFDCVSKSRQVFGESNNHKLISDALDVAQLFFYFKKVKNKYPNAEITAWDPKKNITEAVQNPASELFARTLELFWKQDGDTYNFNRVNHIFILRINYKVIGATSPATMFFAAQDVHKYDLDFNFDNVKLFDPKLESIVERDEAFISFMYAAYRHPYFSQCFPELYQYLSVCLPELQKSNYELWDKIQPYDGNTLVNEFLQLNTGDTPPVEVCGIPICSDQPNPDLIPKKSGFTIKTSKQFKTNVLPPLVLPTEPFFLPWVYTNNVWDNETKVPEYDKCLLNERILPGQADQYPYLTLGDFLEDKLIEVPYDINSTKYQVFGFDRYLLPLKPLFFEYFEVEDIVRNKMISIDTTVPNAVRVHLSIPTSSGVVEYKKIYSEDMIFLREMHLGMFPLLIDPKKVIPINYHIGLIDQEEYGNVPIDLEFYSHGDRVDSKDVNKVVRLEKIGKEGSYHYKFNKEFDGIRVTSANEVNGFILPNFTKLPRKPGQAKVAIDFGTTNTHIEYKYDDGTEKAFDVKDVYGSLSVEVTAKGRRKITEQLLEAEVFPKEIGGESEFKFPLRTALLENDNTNWAATPSLFQNSNVSYFYEKTSTQAHHNVITDLKWNNLADSVEKIKVVHFVEGLLEGIKYKLLADGVFLGDTTIKWLYPVSMTFNQRMLLTNIWEDAVEKMFGQKITVESIPESIAPYTYYNHARGLMGLTASIDIGGGTSDIAIFEKENAKMISSVAFAGNAVVGDAYNCSLQINGFYQAFNKKFQQACDDKKAPLQKNILDQIVKGRKPDSSNFNSFLFSVDNSVFDYSEELRLHPTMKFPYLLFYASQAFYLANLMKMCGSDIPNNIIFSGSGAKSLEIIDQDRRGHSLTKMLFDFIFNNVYRLDNSDIKIELTPNPKEVTCKGALLGSPIDLKNKTGFWLGGKEQYNQVYYESDLNKPDYQVASSDEFKNDILKSLSNFFDLFDKYVNTNDLSDVYGIDNSAMTVFKRIRDRNLKEYLEKGLSEKLKAANGTEAPVAEGLFFYPLVGLLNSLATELANQKKGTPVRESMSAAN